MHNRINSIVNWAKYNKTKVIIIGSGLVLVISLVTGAFVYFNYKNKLNNTNEEAQIEETLNDSQEEEDIESLVVVTIKHVDDNFTITREDTEVYNGNSESDFYDNLLTIINEEGSSSYQFYYDNGSEKLECIPSLKDDSIVLTLQNNSELVITKGKEVVEQESTENFEAKKEETKQNSSSSIAKNPTTSNNSSVSKPSNNNNSSTNKPSSGNNNNNNNSNNNSGSSNNKPSKPQEPQKPEKPQEPEKPTNPPVEKPQRTWQYMESMSNELFNLINDYRQQNGLNAVRFDAEVHAKAKARAELNASREGSGHDNLQISITTGRDDTPREFLQRWIDSPNHRNYMLSDLHTRGGVAIYKDSNDIYYIVAGLDMDF